MKKYLTAEFLKTKRTILRKMLVIIPILCAVISSVFNFLGMADFTTDSVFTSLNHWGLLWIPALIALLCGMFHKLEKDSTDYKTIFSFPIDLKKSWISKIIVLSVFTLIASAFLFVLLIIMELVFTKPKVVTVPFYNCFTALIITWIVSLWQIPLCLYLSKKIKFFVLLLATCAANMELGPAFLAYTSLWWLSPWTLTLRLQAPILHYHPNGLPLQANSPLLNPSVIPVGILIGIVLFLVLVILTTHSFEKSEVR